MATLEIHDADGSIRYLTISRDQPVLFGSDPKADIVLNDPVARPYHGRIRWRKGKYKVEPMAGIDALEVNGQKVVSATLGQGAEIAVGSARIFLVTPDDGPIDSDKTEVRSMPGPAAGPIAPAGPPLVLTAEVAPPSVEQDFGDVREVLKRQRPWAGKSAQAAPDPAGIGKPVREKPPAPTPWDRLKRLVLPEVQAPGQERIAGSPLVIGLILAFATLVAVGYGLYEVIGRMASERRYNLALEDLDAGNYREAIERFERFVANDPEDPRAGKAKVLAALASVQQYATANPSWSNALDSAEEALAAVGEEAAFEDSRADLAEIVYKVAAGLADAAKSSADASLLAKSERAAVLHDQVGGEPAKAVRLRMRFPARLDAARAAVVKARVRRDALGAMDRALQAKDPAATYAARDGLVSNYADLTADAAVLERLRTANQLIQAAVKVDESRRAAADGARAELLGPPLSLVYRSTDAAAAPNSSPVFALAEGFAFAVDGATGAPLWQRALGLDAPYTPRPIPGASSGLLAVDARSQELLRLDSRDGRVVWRQTLGEAVESPPLVLGNQLYQATPNGRLLVIDLDSGGLLTTVELGRRLTQTPVADELGQTLYVMAREDVVFILKRDPVECLSVEYLGHEPGSIPSSPARLGNYFVVTENHGPDRSRWSIFLIRNEGRSLRLLQRQEFAGWAWETPAAMGPVIWSATDRGGAEAFAIGPYEDPKPFKSIAKQPIEGAILGPTFPRARNERELWIASGRSMRLDLDAEAGAIAPKWSLAQAGAAVAPIQTAGRLIVLSQQAPESSGMMLWGVDPTNGSVGWRTLLGAPWTIQPEPSDDGEALSTLESSGHRLLLTADDLTHGGFVAQPLPAPGQQRLPTGRIGRVETSAWTVILPRRDEARIWVRQGESAEIEVIDLPAPAATPLKRWGDGLLVAATDGRAYLLDALTGAPTAEPFLPNFDRERPITWRDPAVVDDATVILADTGGRLRRLAVEEGPPRRLTVEAETDLETTLDGRLAATASVVLVKVDDRRLRAFAVRDLSPAGAWELDAPIVWGPESRADHLFVADAGGTIHAISSDGRKLWTLPLSNGSVLSGRPAVLGDEVWFTTTAGDLVRARLGTGELVSTTAMDVIPVDGPSVLGDRAVIGTAPGTLQLGPAQ